VWRVLVLSAADPVAPEEVIAQLKAELDLQQQETEALREALRATRAQLSVFTMQRGIAAATVDTDPLRSAALGRLTRIVAHEFNNLMQIVALGAAEAKGKAPGASGLSEVLEAVERGKLLVSELMLAGGMSAEPEQPVGSPVAELQPSRTEERAPRAEKILVVDDVRAIREITERTLERAGYGVSTADSAEEAVAIVAKDPSAFDLVILDILMSGRTGLWAFEEIRRLVDVPCLFTTGFSPSTVTEALEKHDRVALLMKPFDPPLLLDAVIESLKQTP